eukprot:325521-Amphidinium_carterae.1
MILAQGYGAAAPAQQRTTYGQARLQAQQTRVQRGYVPQTQGSAQGGKQGQKGWTKGKGKGKRDLASVIARTRCARCGVIGHWARSCTAAIGNSGGGQQHYQSTERAAAAAGGAAGGSAAAVAAHVAAHPQQAIFFTHGLNMEPGTHATLPEGAVSGSSLCLAQTGAPTGLGLKKNEGVIDTGAQSACVGKRSFVELCAALQAEFGLRPFRLPSPAKQTHGIGGCASVLHAWNIPVALGRVPGLLTVSVLDDDNIPLLLPISLQRRLGMQLDVVNNKILWQHLGVRSNCRALATGHIACNVLEFPETGWQIPSFFAADASDVLPNMVLMLSCPSPSTGSHRGSSARQEQLSERVHVESEGKGSPELRYTEQQQSSTKWSRTTSAEAHVYSMHQNVDQRTTQGTSSGSTWRALDDAQGMVARNVADGSCESHGADQQQDSSQGGGGRDISHRRGRGDGQGIGTFSEHLVHHRGN